MCIILFSVWQHEMKFCEKASEFCILRHEEGTAEILAAFGTLEAPACSFYSLDQKSCSVFGKRLSSPRNNFRPSFTAISAVNLSPQFRSLALPNKLDLALLSDPQSSTHTSVMMYKNLFIDCYGTGFQMKYCPAFLITYRLLTAVKSKYTSNVTYKTLLTELIYLSD